MKAPLKRSASLTFRGFTAHPSEVEAAVGATASRVLLKGHPVKPGVSTLAVRSAAVFKLPFAPDAAMRGMIPELLNHFGGVEHLQNARAVVAPEFLEIDLVIDVRNSEYSEDGAIELESLQALVALGATLSFSFPTLRDEG